MKPRALLALVAPILAVACTLKPSDNRIILHLNDFEVDTTGAADCAPAFNRAIDSCSSVGAVLIVPSGTYLCSTIFLKSNVELRLEEGALLLGMPDAESYSSFLPGEEFSKYDSGDGTLNRNSCSDPQWMKAMFVADRVENLIISGGTIDGRHVFNPLGEEGMRGPHTFIVAGCKNLIFKNVTVRRAANYAFLGLGIENAVFQGLDISEGWDGLHLRGAENVIISDSRLATGDDCIAGGYWKNFMVSGCSLNSSCNGIRMIMPSEDVVIEKLKISGPGEFPHLTSGAARRTASLFGIVLEPGSWGPAPGVTRRIHIRDLEIDNVSSPLSFSIRGDGHAEDILVENIRATRIQGSTAPVVSWQDSGFDRVCIRGLDYSR